MRLGLLPPAQRPTLDEARAAPLRKADVDDIEVSGHDRLREDNTRLAHDLGAEVPIREMREDQHLDTGFTRQLCSAEGCRVELDFDTPADAVALAERILSRAHLRAV